MGWSDAGPLLALVDELVTSLSQQQVTIDQSQQAIVQLREQNQDLRRPLNRNRGNRGQPASQDSPRRAKGGAVSRVIPATPCGPYRQNRWTRWCTTGRRLVITVRRPCERTKRCIPSVAKSTACRPRHPRPVTRIVGQRQDLFGVSLSTGTVQNLCWRLLQRRQKAMPQLRAPALQIPVAGLDETGYRVTDRTAWLPVICHQDLTDYRLGGRGEVWADYASVAVHDRFASYWSRRPKVTAHALCHVHLLPNRQEIVAQDQAPDGCTRPAPMPAIPTSWSRGPSWRHNGQR